MAGVQLAAQVDPAREVLDRSAQVYRSLGDYTIDIRMSSSGQSLAIDPKGLGLGMAPGVLLPLWNDITLSRSGNAFRYELRTKNMGTHLIWLTDGVTEWQYVPNLREYREYAAVEWPKIPGPGDGLAGIEWRYITKFQALAGMSSSATIIHDETPAGKDCPEPSVSLQLQLAAPPRIATERMSILARSGLVCRSVVRRVSMRPGLVDQTITTIWDYSRLRQTLDPAAFTFVPPKGFKRVKALRQTSARE